MVKYVKLICGYREDQEHTIPLEEAHKAYRIFLNPNERAIFSNGLAISGQDLKQIIPDYHSTMGWNTSHKLDGDDWNELKAKGIDRELQQGLYLAQQVVRLVEEKHDPSLLQKPLSEVVKLLPEVKVSNEAKQLADKFKV